jgi:phosphatidylglycerol---prolipoprotein diacylglyceryl transferase
MYPIICKIGPFVVYSYGLMLAVAFIFTSSLAVRQAGKHGLNPDAVFNLCFLTFIFGIVGARALYVIENIHYYLKNPFEMIMLQRGGLSWFGGLILGVISSVVYLRIKKIPVYKALDLLSPFIALGQAIGRIGCLLNGCCFGKVSDYGIYCPVHDSVLVPTQIYSSLALLLIFIALRFLQDRPHKEGAIFFSYLMLYSVKRFFIEFWRADNAIIIFGLTLFQLLSIAIFCIASWKLISIVKPNK